MSVVIFFDVLLHYVKMLFTLSKSLVLCISDVMCLLKEVRMFMVKPHTSDIWMTYEYI